VKASPTHLVWTSCPGGFLRHFPGLSVTSNAEFGLPTCNTAHINFWKEACVSQTHTCKGAAQLETALGTAQPLEQTGQGYNSLLLQICFSAADYAAYPEVQHTAYFVRPLGQQAGLPAFRA
jgi:hypothetical protein